MSAAPIDLKFVSSDNKEFLIPSDVIKMSSTVNTLLTDLGLEDLKTTNGEAIPLHNVDAKTLKKVIAWCKHHHQNPAPVAPVNAEEESNTNGLSDYAMEFFKISQTEIFELILAANYLNIEGLLDAGCKTIASLMKGLSPQELCEKFEIVNDFTPEEQEAIRKENAWCED